MRYDGYLFGDMEVFSCTPGVVTVAVFPHKTHAHRDAHGQPQDLPSWAAMNMI